VLSSTEASTSIWYIKGLLWLLGGWCNHLWFCCALLPYCFVAVLGTIVNTERKWGTKHRIWINGKNNPKFCNSCCLFLSLIYLLL